MARGSGGGGGTAAGGIGAGRRGVRGRAGTAVLATGDVGVNTGGVICPNAAADFTP